MCLAFVRTFSEPHKPFVTKRVMVMPFLVLLLCAFFVVAVACLFSCCWCVPFFLLQVCAFFVVAGAVVLFAFRILSDLKCLCS